MDKWQREVQESLLDSEEAVLKELRAAYEEALENIQTKVKVFQFEELNKSRIYRMQHQKALMLQVSSILDKLRDDEYTSIDQFLSETYSKGYIGAMYEISKQGVPLVQPIDQNAAVKAILTDSELSSKLYDSIHVDMQNLKKTITAEISRGIASDMPYADIARNISDRASAPLSRAKTIARTEGHRIQQASQQDAREVAKAKGADVVKQWDASLDGATRPTHRKLDGQIREINKPFEMDGKKAMYPGKFGKPEEDCNCRCVALTRARWALDEDELKILEERAAQFKLDKTKDFKEYREKYLQATSEKA